MTPEPTIEEIRAYCRQTVQTCQKEANDLKASNQHYIAENAKLREALIDARATLLGLQPDFGGPVAAQMGKAVERINAALI